MPHLDDGRRPAPRSPRATRAVGCAAALSLAALSAAACSKAAGRPDAGTASRTVAAASGGRVSACALLPKSEASAITGEVYTAARGNDDSPSESGCQYSNPVNTAGLSIDINWLNPRDYDGPAEHAALRRASMGGATLAGKLTAGMPTAPGVPDGPVDGVGDEARMNMMRLTARKGDYTVAVQIIATDVVALMTDSTYAPGLVEKEKAIARKVLAKL